MAEFDRLGRSAFLEKYGFRPAREYFVYESGQLYDSKALMGAAHCFEPGQRALRHEEFSGGDATVGRRLARLGFRVTRTFNREPNSSVEADPVWTLRVGQRIKRTELHRRYGGSGQDGIAPSRSTPHVLVFSDPASGERHGYRDGWREDGFFYYTGRGQRGNQVFESGNLAILNHAENGRALRVFQGAGGIVTYIGRFSLADDTPWVHERAPETAGGPERNVIMFRLAPIIESETSSARNIGTPKALGETFSSRNENIRLDRIVPTIDPDTVARGLQAHRSLESLLAEGARSHGFQPCNPPIEGPA